MGDEIKLGNRGPFSRTLEFGLGFISGFLMATGLGSCKVPEGSTLGITCDETGCEVHGGTTFSLDPEGELYIEAPAGELETGDEE
jgi:hypothetical protein